MKKKETGNKPQSAKTAKQRSNHFVCMKHPDVKKTKPGKCPKCGLSLRLKK